MTFSAGKSELLHFTRAYAAQLDTVTLDPAEPTDGLAVCLTPAASARFVDIWLDRKLLFRAHTDQVLRKFKTQWYVFTRLTAKTWGCDIP